MKVIKYEFYNQESPRSKEEQIAAREKANSNMCGNKPCCFGCLHFTQVSRIDSGQCHVTSTRKDVLDHCDKYDMPYDWKAAIEQRLK